MTPRSAPIKTLATSHVHDFANARGDARASACVTHVLAKPWGRFFIEETGNTPSLSPTIVLEIMRIVKEVV